jgi:hypothetical protein
MAIELFGVCAVTVMVVAYALERRSHVYVLVFAIGCAAAALYGVLIRSWPFAGVETIWCAIALRRWHERRTAPSGARPRL